MNNVLMREKLTKRLFLGAQKALKPLERALANVARRRMRIEHSADPAGIAKKILEGAGVEIIHEERAENGPALQEMRKKLSTEPGVIICNHPSHFETLAVLEMLKRPDIKVVVSRYAVATPLFGEENFIVSNPSASREEFARAREEMKSHIEKGGLLVLFPTGGAERYSEEFLFKSGFSLLVRDILRPTDMVYACHADEVEAKSLKKQTSMRLLAALAGLKWQGKALFERRALHLRESYTTVDMWKSALIGADSRREENRRLTKLYSSLFRRD